jgi:hypothetical protein
MKPLPPLTEAPPPESEMLPLGAKMSPMIVSPPPLNANAQLEGYEDQQASSPVIGPTLS